MCFLRQEAHGFLGNSSCITVPKSQWLNSMYSHLLLMSQSNVANTWGALFHPMLCGSMHLLSVALPSPRTFPDPLCFQLAKREIGVYQVYHTCTLHLLPESYHKAQASWKKVWTWSVPLHPGRENSWWTSGQSADSERLLVGPSLALWCNTRRTAERHKLCVVPIFASFGPWASSLNSPVPLSSFEIQR